MSKNNNSRPVGRQIRNDAAKPIYANVLKAAWIGLIANLALGSIKLVTGIITNSFALIADAINSLGDVLTTLATLVAIFFAQKPPDAQHPYGHTRAEAIAGINVALLVLLSAIWVGFEAITRFFLEHEIPPSWVLWIAGGNVVIKEGLYQYKKQIAQKTKSSAIMAHAWDHRADAFSALAALIGIAIVRMAGPEYIWADELAALIIVFIISISALKIFRSSASELMDAQADPELIEQIRSVAIQTKGIIEIETLWVRKSGLEYLADIHVEVDGNLSVREGHTISHHLRDDLLKHFDSLRDVLVHLEPHKD